ncbi:MAG: F0F1 ATP synthase subunit delta [Bacteroidota bacterium]|nr:F0F1 ATP synthase subunit delta [Bacteroidota bacterium]
MNVGLISARFAKALYDFSVSAGEDEMVHEELIMVHKQLNEVPVLGETLLSPIVSAEDKIRLMIAATGRIPTASLTRFFRLLIAHRREELLPSICESYMRLFDKEKGILKVRLITAVPLEETKKDKIVSQLETSTHKKVELSMLVQPDIIGGFVLMTDEKRLDASVRTSLKNIRRQMTI